MIGAILLGLVAGAIAKLLVPNDVTERWGGAKAWLAAMVIGLVGALLGYLVFTVLLGIGDTDIFDWGGILSAIIGAVIVLIIAGFVMRRAGPRTT